MSRIANKPIEVPKGVEIHSQGKHIEIKGPKGTIKKDLDSNIQVVEDTTEGDHAGHKIFKIKITNTAVQGSDAMAGTVRALVHNMVVGVTQGFVKELKLVGVGYRAQAQGKKVNLSLGFSHPVVVDLPNGITAETPENTIIRIVGIDKQLVGQVAAEIRAIRPPEPYKGKGVLYATEKVKIKEIKK